MFMSTQNIILDLELLRSTGTPAYLSQLIHHYQPTRTLRLSDKLSIFVPKMTLALSAKAFTVSAPSIWNSLSYKCRSAELLDQHFQAYFEN